MVSRYSPESACRPLDQVGQYYKGLGDVLPSMAGRLFSDPNVRHVASDDRMQIGNMLSLLKGRVPCSVLTILGNGYTPFFARRYPHARISSFEINPKQLETFGQEALGFGDVFISDIGIPSDLAKLVQQADPELMFCSNVVDYLSEVEKAFFAREIVNAEVPALLVTENVPSPASLVTNQKLVWDVLQDQGYKHEFEYSRGLTNSTRLFYRDQWVVQVSNSGSNI